MYKTQKRIVRNIGGGCRFGGAIAFTQNSKENCKSIVILHTRGMPLPEKQNSKENCKLRGERSYMGQPGAGQQGGKQNSKENCKLCTRRPLSHVNSSINKTQKRIVRCWGFELQLLHHNSDGQNSKENCKVFVLYIIGDMGETWKQNSKENCKVLDGKKEGLGALQFSYKTQKRIVRLPWQATMNTMLCPQNSKENCKR